MTTYYLTILFASITAKFAEVSKGKYKDLTLDPASTHPNRLFVMLTAIILICVAGLRWGVGTDYWSYANNYTGYLTNWWGALVNWNEPGIYFIAKFSSWIYNDYVSMFFLASAITIGLSVRVISKHSSMFTFSILLYIFMGSWHGGFNGVRQYLASAIIFAGHNYIIERKLIKYILVVLVASAFHTSALLMFFLYFTPLTRLKIKQLALLVVGTFLIFYSYDIIFTVFANLRGRDIGSSAYITRDVNLFRVLVSLAPLVIYFTLTSKRGLSKRNLFYINMLFVNASLLFATSNSAYLARVGIYSRIFTTLSFPILLNFRDKYLTMLIKMLIIGFYALYWYVEVSQSSNLSNFQWVFSR